MHGNLGDLDSLSRQRKLGALRRTVATYLRFIALWQVRHPHVLHEPVREALCERSEACARAHSLVNIMQNNTECQGSRILALYYMIYHNLRADVFLVR